MAASVHNAINSYEIADQDRVTLELLNWEDTATIIGIVSSLLVLISSAQSRELLRCKYTKEERRQQDLPRPAATALMSSSLGIVSVGVLSWSAIRRLEERTKQQQEEQSDAITGALWPNVAIVIGFLLTLAATGLKAAGVGARYAEEAAVVII
ncbi:MAG: hypothetical protein J6Q99_01585 [Oscillospiraceae bacterium]|nr:hypothetical protein [Oscillospiraceae bacterium]